MREWQFSAPGPVKDSLKLIEDAPKPSSEQLKPGEILVEVASAAINPVDYKIPHFGLAAKAVLSFPKVPAMDLSGRVVAIASDVEDVKAGDSVLARLDPLKKPGALAQYAVVARDGYAKLPAAVDLDHAAGAPTVALTAYQSIAPHVKEGDKVFINGGSGGAGTFGVQIAKALGCHVTVTCSTQKRELVEKLGADDIIDYKQSSVVEELRKRGPIFSLVVDNVGNSPPDLYAHAHEFTLPQAPYIFVGGAISMSSGLSLGRSLLLPGFLGGGKRKFTALLTKNSSEDLARIAEWLASGKVQTVMESTFSFEEVPQAYEHLQKGSSAGKIVVHVSQ